VTYVWPVYAKMCASAHRWKYFYILVGTSPLVTSSVVTVSYWLRSVGFGSVLS